MSVIIADSIRNSDSVAPSFDNISATIGNITNIKSSTIVSNSLSGNSIQIGDKGIYIQLAASPTAAYKITLPSYVPTSLQYFGYDGSTYGWLTPALAGVSTSGVNNIICTTGTGFAALAPGTVRQNISAQPLASILTSLANAPMLASGVFTTTSAGAAAILNATQVLSLIGLSPTSSPAFAAVTTPQLIAPAGKLQISGEVLALPGTTDASLVTRAQLNAIASGTVQLAPAVAYCISIGTYANNQITATAFGAFSTDGISVALGARILVNNGTSSAGIYTLAVMGNATTYWQLARSPDELVNARIMVLGGATYIGSSWIYTPAGTFVQDGPSVNILPGAGISVTGRQVQLAPVISPANLITPTNISVNAYGQIIGATSRTNSQVRADLDLISPTFANVTLGNIVIQPSAAAYTIALPTLPPTAGGTLVYNGTSFEWGTVQSTLSGTRPTIVVNYESPNDGGVAAISVWTPYPLNTVATDTTANVAITNNAIKLPGGTFNISASGAFCQVGGCAIRLYDVSHSAVLIQGVAAFSANGTVTIDDGAVVHSVIMGQITLQSPATVRLEYFASVSSGATYELGRTVTANNIYGYLQAVSITDIVAAAAENLTVRGTLSADLYLTQVCVVYVATAATAAILPPKYRTYYLTGTPTAMFMITPPQAPTGAEIVIVNTTGYSGIFTTIYGSYSVANYSKQMFTYVRSMNGWI